ncbi:uncharacterized protein I206_105606 [Kwoniella pini CBS 10737]|uniref:Succinate dehydrogenase assembly factor 4, mitochondrial n=1 Tax=Kwoniella pini CBS 10737 TaxID=1296096 RepID=A0A1B9I3R5_9TREE|nr:uncharacterized protein I206_03494 [Kwoniella pini CBS 10737]OCF50175.1 hypothetical protein I206_03494 [Kwoniella pini CBS 10737]
MSMIRSNFSSIQFLRIPMRSIFTSTQKLTKKIPSFNKPGPPQLPASDQAEFEALIKLNQSIGASPKITESENPSKLIEELKQHKDIRKGPKPDFIGEINPKTGEMGGPKTDPFKAGDQDWSYAGRVTDF